MIQVRNDVIPFCGFKAITIWPFIFIRRNARFEEVDLNHEKIHGRQQLEMLIIPFYLWYVMEWIVRLVFLRDTYAYYNILFEREAYLNERNLDYLKGRKWYAWAKKSEKKVSSKKQ